jgi:signal transduction histidine kinase
MRWRTSATSRAASIRRCWRIGGSPPRSRRRRARRRSRRASTPTRSSDLEAAVYFCCLEALQNVAKYAGASSARVRLSARDGVLRFEVADDGAGFDPSTTRFGTGLQGMADRLDAVGGSLDVRSVPGAGTTIIGSVPLGAAER